MEGILFFGEQLGTRRKSELFFLEVGRADYHLKCRENVMIPLHCQIERENVLTQQVEWWRGFPKVRVQNRSSQQFLGCWQSKIIMKFSLHVSLRKIHTINVLYIFVLTVILQCQ